MAEETIYKAVLTLAARQKDPNHRAKIIGI